MGTLALDASSPASVYSTTTSATTASFTPPANSLVVVWLRYNTGNGETGVSDPTITDSLGAHLTYTLLAHNRRADINNANSAVAVWSAVVPTSQAMTITATEFSAGLTVACALKVQVWTDSSGSAPGTGAVVKGATVSAITSLAAQFTATATGSRGIIGWSDWDTNAGTVTAGTGCTLTGGDAANPFTVAYACVLRSANDGTAAATTTINLNTPSTANARWITVEVVPAVTSAAGTASITGAGTVAAGARQAATAATTGTGTVSAAVRITSGATPTGVGTAAALVQVGTGSSVVGSGAATATVTQRATASVTGAGAASAATGIQAAASTTGAGAITATVTQTAGASTTGSGSAAGSAGGQVAGTATVTGSGTAAALTTTRAPASTSGAGTVSAAGSVSTAATASVTGTGTTSAVAGVQAGVTTLGAGLVSATGGVAIHGTASVVGAGHVTATTSSRIVYRPNAGTVTRPYAGVVVRP